MREALLFYLLHYYYHNKMFFNTIISVFVITNFLTFLDSKSTEYIFVDYTKTFRVLFLNKTHFKK